MSLVTNLIEMQYQNAMQCVEDLEKVAGAVRSVSTSDLDDMFEEISKSWKGEPAATCLGKMVNLQGDIIAEARRIASTAEAVKTIAENIRKAEIEAYRIATGRDYS